ncbi:hypothetical protein LIA77_11937 [Sarocladium implicatum]|nr:hypothetical protein LIA77_11937 [Sarocladium implicatum]
MNPFRTKKAGEDDWEQQSHKGMGAFRQFGRKKGKGKQPQAIVEYDTVLPPSDDFRTSLLLGSLTARFSLLRDVNEDKNRVIFQDESILFPKRHSGLHIFGPDLSAPADEATSTTQLQSVHEEAAIQNLNPPSESVMSRSKPGKGNNLFGGRQKVYMITSRGTGGRGRGRAFYEDDIAHLAFQCWQHPYDLHSARDSLRPNPDAAATQIDDDDAGSDHPDLPFLSTRLNKTTLSSNHTSDDRNMSDDLHLEDETTSIHANRNYPERRVTLVRQLYEKRSAPDLRASRKKIPPRLDILATTKRVTIEEPDNSPDYPFSATSTRARSRISILLDDDQVSQRTYTPLTANFTPTTPFSINECFDQSDSHGYGKTPAQSYAMPSGLRPDEPGKHLTAERPISPSQPSPRFVHDWADNSRTFSSPRDNDHQQFLNTVPDCSGYFSRANAQHPAVSDKFASQDDPLATGKGAGLGGMVFQHLRSDSSTSSTPGDTTSIFAQQDFSGYSPAWESSTQNFSSSEFLDSSLTRFLVTNDRSHPVVHEQAAAAPQASAATDDFSQHLADGARRVRERLNKRYNTEGGGGQTPPLGVPRTNTEYTQPQSKGLSKKSSFRSLRRP